MKINHEYLKGLLEAFEASPEPQTNIRELAKAGYDYTTDEFLFHMRLLDDQGLIGQPDGDYGFGLLVGADGHKSWSVIPLRLTSDGHAFLETLENKEVWNTVKSGFKDVSIGTLVDVSRKLFDGYVHKKIDNILN